LGILWDRLRAEQNWGTAVDQNCEELGCFNMFQDISICWIIWI
jgi:hypothetical protein